MGYLLIAGLFFMGYFLIKEHYDKRLFLKTAKQFITISNSHTDSSELGLSSFEKDTNFYLISDTNDSFLSLNGDNVSIKISDLQYINLVRFQKLFDNYKNNKIADFEFFTHRKNRHLVYPYRKDNGILSIVILERSRMIADDFFGRHH